VAGEWGMSPRQSVLAECDRRGKDAVVAGCVGLLTGSGADDALIVALGGPPAGYVLSGGEGGPQYWLRVWAARGLLHAWADTATPAIIGATTDQSWRVREMAAKVIARHRVGDALTAVAALRDDDVARVRTAAGRAVAILSATAS
jgi:hypothetical protein